PNSGPVSHIAHHGNPKYTDRTAVPYAPTPTVARLASEKMPAVPMVSIQIMLIAAYIANVVAAATNELLPNSGGAIASTISASSQRIGRRSRMRRSAASVIGL